MGIIGSLTGAFIVIALFAGLAFFHYKSIKDEYILRFSWYRISIIGLLFVLGTAGIIWGLVDYVKGTKYEHIEGIVVELKMPMMGSTSMRIPIFEYTLKNGETHRAQGNPLENHNIGDKKVLYIDPNFPTEIADFQPVNTTAFISSGVFILICGAGVTFFHVRKRKEI